MCLVVAWLGISWPRRKDKCTNVYGVHRIWISSTHAFPYNFTLTCVFTLVKNWYRWYMLAMIQDYSPTWTSIHAAQTAKMGRGQAHYWISLLIPDVGLYSGFSDSIGIPTVHRAVVSGNVEFWIHTTQRHHDALRVTTEYQSGLQTIVILLAMMLVLGLTV